MTSPTQKRSGTSYEEIRGILRRWAALDDDDWSALLQTTNLPASPSDRLLIALHSVWQSEDHADWADVAGLARQVLLRASHRRSTSLALWFPLGAGLPTRSQWHEIGMPTLLEDEGVSVSASYWTPNWLEGTGRAAPFEAAVQERQRRLGREDHPLDPDVTELLGDTYSTYSCLGQKQAVRAATLCPPGDTVLAMLPTGSGKSLVFQAVAAAASEALGVSVVVVPTTSLALDHERSLTELRRRRPEDRWPDRFAYHSDLSHVERAALRDRVRAGTQRIVITSPEAATTILRGALYAAARAGLLRYFVIDEAHVVTSWGTEFRPAFQALSGLRRGLLRSAPQGMGAKSLLLTATLGLDGFRFLRSLFATPGELHTVSALHLRPEPVYWLAECSSDLRKERVLEACLRAPRPFLLYVSIPADADRWASDLDEAGVRRVAVVHGKTPPERRLTVIEEWRAGTVDCVVATSAFGLGIDLANVRAVVHACVPETVERYYQEVGRGGRDGRASAAVLLAAPADHKTARRLNTQKTIGPDLGHARWSKMWRERRLRPGTGLVDLDLSVIRDPLPNEGKVISHDTEENRAWNLRTLTLLALAEQITLEDSGATDWSPDTEGEPTGLWVTVRVPDSQALASLDFWKGAAVQEVRARVTTEAQSSLDAMQSLVAGSEEVGQALMKRFSLEQDGLGSPRHVCAGCGRCRADGLDHSQYARPAARFPKSLCHEPSGRVLKAFGALDSLVFFEPPDWSSRAASRRWLAEVRHCVELLVHDGFRELAAPDVIFEALGESGPLRRHLQSPGLLLRGDVHGDRFIDAPSVPRLTILTEPPGGAALETLRSLVRPCHVILLPRTTADPRKPRRRLYDVEPGRMNLGDLKEALS